jgi:hypothetical protein
MRSERLRILASHTPDIWGEPFPLSLSATNLAQQIWLNKHHNFFLRLHHLKNLNFDMVPHLQISLFASNVHFERENLVVTSELVDKLPVFSYCFGNLFQGQK